MAGDDHAGVEGEDRVARGDPVRYRPGPDDRRALDEQDVAGEHRGGVGHVRDRVAGGVRRAELDQLDDAIADAQLAAAGERLGGQARRDALEVEAPHRAPGERIELRTEVELVEQQVDELRPDRLHLLERRGGGHDRDPVRQQLVAEPVVAVAVRVHRLLDRVAIGDRLDRVEQLSRALQVEQRVDEQRRALAGDQPGVAPAPAAVRLLVRVQAIAEFVQLHRAAKPESMF